MKRKGREIEKEAKVLKEGKNNNVRDVRRNKGVGENYTITIKNVIGALLLCTHNTFWINVCCWH